jgi:hypothetical protein
MCTIAWLPRSEGFTLWHSRDERRSRGIAVPPLVEHGNGISWISPRDSDSGGTWVGVNSFGVTVGIANLFVAGRPVPPGRKISRGLLVEQLLDSPSLLQVERRVRAFDLEPFEPFTLVGLETDHPPFILRWDRTAPATIQPLGPHLLATSAGGSQAIEDRRIGLFAPGDHEMTANEIEELYRLPPESERASVCVHRGDVMTVSLVRIEVGARQVALAYTPGQPCQTPAGPTIMLDRVSGREASAPYMGNIG